MIVSFLEEGRFSARFGKLSFWDEIRYVIWYETIVWTRLFFNGFDFFHITPSPSLRNIDPSKRHWAHFWIDSEVLFDKSQNKWFFKNNWNFISGFIFIFNNSETFPKNPLYGGLRNISFRQQNFADFIKKCYKSIATIFKWNQVKTIFNGGKGLTTWYQDCHNIFLAFDICCVLCVLSSNTGKIFHIQLFVES